MAPEFATSPALSARDYDAKRLVRERLRARQSRVRTLRKRVAAVLLAAFAALWLGIYVQLATGHDPGLVAGAARKATSTTSTTSTTAAAAPAATAATAVVSTTANTSSTAVTTRSS